MRSIKLAAAALLACALLSAPGCSCTDIHEDVVELRKLHAAYRSAVVPRPDLDPAKVQALEGKLDATLANLEELTK
jgi:hypothetical protein